jgi:sec-independent protein translocase protein TatB
MVVSPPIEIAIVSMPDTLLIMVLALVFFGPRRLPEIGRQIGKLMYEFRKASNEFKFQMEEELRQAEEADRRKKEEAERERTLAALPAPVPVEAPAVESAAAVDPYPSDSTYPNVAGEPAAETSMSVQPPSTGETVTAAPPHKPAENTAAEPAIATEPVQTEARHG